MASKSLRAQLNQIRAWVREGRTDAWIAHQLEVPASELREFRRRHGLSADGEPEDADDLRDEIEAEVEAATLAAEDEEEEEEDGVDEGDEDERDEDGDRPRGRDRATRGDDDDEEEEDDEDRGGSGDGRRRRRRRGGRGRRRVRKIEATFDHGDDEGYGLWLDPSIKDNPTYTENWAGKRRVEVSIEPDQIVIRRSEN